VTLSAKSADAVPVIGSTDVRVARVCGPLRRRANRGSRSARMGRTTPRATGGGGVTVLELLTVSPKAAEPVPVMAGGVLLPDAETVSPKLTVADPVIAGGGPPPKSSSNDIRYTTLNTMTTFVLPMLLLVV